MIKKLKINSSIYDVEYINELKGDKNEDLYGEIEYSKLKISICTNCCDFKQLQALLHESLHGIEIDYGFDFEENVIERLGNAIFALIIDNKEFFKNIIEYGNC